MATASHFAFDPLLSPAGAATMVRICESFGSFKMYSEEPTFAGIGEGLPARWDAVRNFVKTVGRFGRPVIEPAIVYANLLVPGQELAVHTDVPEFRGVSRKQHPQWLIVAMHHSGLFEPWRMPIATGVSWFHDCSGGEFAFYPDGAD